MEKNYTPLAVRNLRKIAENLRNTLLTRGYYSADVTFRISHDNSWRPLSLSLEYRVEAGSTTTHESIAPTKVSEVAPQMEDVPDNEDPDYIVRVLVDAAYIWIDNQPTVREARQAELVRTMERARDIAEDLGVETEVGNVLVDLMKKLAKNALTDRS